VVSFTENVPVSETHSNVDAEKDPIHGEHPKYIWEEEQLALVLDARECLLPVCFIHKKCHIRCACSRQIVDGVKNTRIMDSDELLELFLVLNVRCYGSRLSRIFVGALSFICCQGPDIFRLWDEEYRQDENQAAETSKKIVPCSPPNCGSDIACENDERTTNDGLDRGEVLLVSGTLVQEEYFLIRNQSFGLYELLIKELLTEIIKGQRASL